MLRSTDRIRTSHAGALEQPESLREVIRKRDEGQPYDQEAFDRGLRSAVAEVVKRRVECGLDSVCDGEFGKQNFTSYVGTRIRKAPLSPLQSSDLDRIRDRSTGGEPENLRFYRYKPKNTSG